MLRSFAPLLFALPVWYFSGQEPEGRPQETPTSRPNRDPFGRPTGDAPAGAGVGGVDALQGAWQLVDFSDENFPDDGRQALGYMLVSGSHLALELHMSFDDIEFEEVFQSGIHEYRVDAVGQLQLLSLIGAHSNVDEDLLIEPAGFARSYGLSLQGAFLTLTRADGTHFEFARLPSRAPASRDIYGRLIGAQNAAKFYGKPGQPAEDPFDRDPGPPPSDDDDDE